ncbi:hypothetical protein ABTX35_02970 [Streptomyces sp. NPDC096080]|uniref:hypothetical protein n=1 Tax=Streptomyces sp. NPDC096080 TaxID=3156693 RepID=UPI00331E739F
MESPPPEGALDDPKQEGPRAWYVFSDDLPDDEVLVPIVLPDGRTVMAVRPGEMTDRLLGALNHALNHLIGTGLWQPGDDGPEGPEDRKE